MNSEEALERFKEIMRERPTAEELGVCKLDTCAIPREKRKCLTCKHLDDGEGDESGEGNKDHE